MAKKMLWCGGGIGVVLVVAVAILTMGAMAAEASGGDQYLIISSHTPEKCLADLDAVLAEKPQLLDSIEWGCKSGDHTGYLIVNADSETAARELLPTSMQKDARVIKLNKFTAEEIRSYHTKG